MINVDEEYRSLQQIQFFENANEAFNFYNYAILAYGLDYGNTKCLFNVGFYINNPTDNYISNKSRKWNLDYAKAEWQWYLSGNSNVNKLGKLYGSVPKIWLNISNDNGEVNSNYGSHWFNSDFCTDTQYCKLIETLKSDTSTRRASLSVYSMENVELEDTDVPCTYAVNFYICDNKLNMSVVMRSNDLWFGFCNDQYCFSELQKKVFNDIKLIYPDLEIGNYYHFANNLHLYKKQLK